ncbi:hypothetical protein [Pseudoalteromonas rubra]|uniref:hypothetical protein n=1 Tax=Pseudoalteromonas rubra TaxID=43658 RepID=UPI002DB9E130|nr:hypothetical protein [Pseudoalteromonas rubra]MEC4091859.1 hypothetical protein [Pseudoalteromonas rubra]
MTDKKQQPSAKQKPGTSAEIAAQVQVALAQKRRNLSQVKGRLVLEGDKLSEAKV